MDRRLIIWCRRISAKCINAQLNALALNGKFDFFHVDTNTNTMNSYTYAEFVNDITILIDSYPKLGELIEKLELIKLISQEDQHTHKAVLFSLRKNIMGFGNDMTKRMTSKQYNRVKSIISAKSASNKLSIPNTKREARSSAAKSATLRFITMIPTAMTVRDLNELVCSHYCEIINNMQFSKNMIAILENHCFDWNTMQFVDIDPISLAPILLSALMKHKNMILDDYDDYDSTNAADVTVKLVKDPRQLTEELVQRLPLADSLEHLSNLIGDWYRDVGTPSPCAEKILDAYGFSWKNMKFYDDYDFETLLSSLSGEFLDNKEKIISEMTSTTHLQDVFGDGDDDNTNDAGDDDNTNDMLVDILKNLIKNLNSMAYSSSINGCLGEYYELVTDSGIKHDVVTGIDQILKSHGWRWDDQSHGFQTAVDCNILTHQINCCIADKWRLNYDKSFI